MSYGFVYLLGNKAMPGLYKVGMTERPPHLRAQQLAATGVPLPFDVLCYFECEQMAEEERALHAIMADFRVNSGREFFRFHSVHMPWVLGLFRFYPYRLCFSECDAWRYAGSYDEPENPWNAKRELQMTRFPPDYNEEDYGPLRLVS